MAMLREWVRRLWAAASRRRSDSDLQRELRTRVGMAAEDARSKPSERVERAAAFRDSPNSHAMALRDRRGVPWLEDLAADVRYSLRSLRHSPVFAAAAILTLSIGIGAATSIYTIVNAVVLRPLDFPNSDQLVRVVENVTIAGRQLQGGIDYAAFAQWQAESKTMTDVAGVIALPKKTVRGNAGTAAVWGGMLSGNTFAMLGGRAIIGRTLNRGDETQPVAVLAFETWQRHFDSDPRIVGRAVEFRAAETRAQLLTVVGVMSPDFSIPIGRLDYFTPITRDAKLPPRVTMLARLHAETQLASAALEANQLGQQLSPPRPPNAPPLPGARFEVLPLKDLVVGPWASSLNALLGAVAILLLIVCANVANLVLARGTGRSRELTVRLAMGASRSRIVRQILADCFVLASIGSIGGAALGALGVAGVKALATIEATGILRRVFGAAVLPRVSEIGIDAGILMTAFGLAAISCAIFGLFPALHLSRLTRLRAAAGATATRSEGQSRNVLVAAQLALATVLLVSVGLLARSFVNITNVDDGYDASDVLTFQLLLSDEYPMSRRVDTIETILSRLRATPEVLSVGFARHGMLMPEQVVIGTFVPEGRTLEEMNAQPDKPRMRAVSAGFAETMRIPVRRGRWIRESDGGDASAAIVINHSFARRYFGDQDPVGRTLQWHFAKAGVPATVVGVVDDVHNEAMTDTYAEAFVDYRQLLTVLQTWGLPPSRQNDWALGLLSFALRTRNAPEAAIPIVREVVRGVDPNIGIDSIVSMDRMMAYALTRQRFYTVVVAVVAAVAALLATIGIYGLLAYSVAQRTQEIGLRVALGASRNRVILLVLRRGLGLAAIGITAGLAVAAAMSSYLQDMVFGITPLDVSTYLLVALGFSLVALVASLVPARKATRIEPMVALRCD